MDQGTSEEIALVDSAVSPPPSVEHVSAEEKVELSRRERHDQLSEAHEIAIDKIGFGRFQWLAFFVVGFAMMGDMVEIFVTAFIISSAEKEFCMDSKMKGMLGGIVFAGMTVGSFLFGILGDLVGRRPVLLSGLVIGLIFGVASAFCPYYGLFVCCRAMIGLAVGGCLAVWGPYLVELIPRHRRGAHLTFALFMWSMGAVYACIAAWLIIPADDALTIEIQSGLEMHSWRIYLLVCAVPLAIAFVGVMFLPETPRYLLEIDKTEEAIAIYQTIYRQNHPSDKEVPHFHIPQIPRVDVLGHKGCCSKFFSGVSDHMGAIRVVFSNKYILKTMKLAWLWFSISFANFGLDIWFPEYLAKLQMGVYISKQNQTANVDISERIYTGFIDNVAFVNASFSHVAFENVILKHVTFENTEFRDCTFRNVTSPQTRFSGVELTNCFFNDTDLYSYKFDSFLSDNNTQWLNTRTGCMVDFNINVNTERGYLETLIGQLANIPGLAVSALLMETVKRKTSATLAFFLTALSTFLLWAVSTELSVVIINCVINFAIMMTWNPTEVITIESYPTYLRNTAFGICVATGKLSGILGNVVFAAMIDVNVAVPVLTTAAVLFLGGLVSTRITETKDNLV